jgi:uncharacterized protein YraI
MNKPRFLGRGWLIAILVVVLVTGLLPSVAVAQGVSIVTNANAKLRSGPGTEFADQGIIPADTVLTAIGRNADSSWIQVNFNGAVGWVAIFLLNVTGDVNTLPVVGADQAAAPPADAVQPPPPGVVSATTSSLINVRASASTGAAKIGELPAGSTVVLITRSGSGGNAWVSFDFQGQRGWIASWLVQVNGDVNTLRDVQARTQGLDALQRGLDAARPRWEPVAPFWRDLAGGLSVGCVITSSRKPVAVSVSQSILDQNPDIADALNVLNYAVAETSRAIDEWVAECSIDRTQVPFETVNSGVSAVNNADNAFNDVQNRINAMRLN